MAHDGEFQEKIRKLGERIAGLDQLPQSASGAGAKELVQLLMDLHGAGLERILEIIFEAGDEGQRIIGKLGRDPLAGSLLLLYSLHPDDVETRVQTAVERIRPRLRKLSCTVDAVEVRDGAVQMSLTASGHGCGSSAAEVRSIVEEVMYELAPDLVSLQIAGLDQPATAGFVSLDSLMGKQLAETAHGRAHAGEAAAD